jgi:hypothetical protein
MLIIFLKAASNVSVILLAKPHQAKQLVNNINGHKILCGITRTALFSGEELDEDDTDILSHPYVS